MPVWLLAAPAAGAQSFALLPDAPLPRAIAATASASGLQSSSQSILPQQTTAPGARPTPATAGSVDHASFETRKWSQYVDPGEHVPRLSDHDKWFFWLHEEFRLSTPLPAFISAGYGQLTDTPKYGSDSGAFGDRLGAAFLRQATMRFFCSSMFPVLYHEDPRYYRKASGSYLSRAAWAAEQALVTQRDSGRLNFNFSDIFGHLAASALTLAYYPAPSRTKGVVMQTWGTSIAGAAGNNLFLEFVPDAINAWHNRKHHVVPHSSRTR